jgi:hypothetical protein
MGFHLNRSRELHSEVVKADSEIEHLVLEILGNEVSSSRFYIEPRLFLDLGHDFHLPHIVRLASLERLVMLVLARIGEAFVYSG